jgi:hypothetical protein
MNFVKLDKLSLLSELGLNNLDVANQQKLFTIIADILETKIFEMILSNLDENQQINFLQLVADKKEKMSQEFVKKNIKNLDKKIESVVNQVKKELASEIKSAKLQQ